MLCTSRDTGADRSAVLLTVVGREKAVADCTLTATQASDVVPLDEEHMDVKAASVMEGFVILKEKGIKPVTANLRFVP